jgi:hypothetical protein
MLIASVLVGRMSFRLNKKEISRNYQKPSEGLAPEMLIK